MENIIFIYLLSIFLIICGIGFLLVSPEKDDLCKNVTPKIKIIYTGAVIIGLLTFHLNWMLLTDYFEKLNLITSLLVLGMVVFYFSFMLWNCLKQNKIILNQESQKWEEEISLQIAEVLMSESDPVKSNYKNQRHFLL